MLHKAIIVGLGQIGALYDLEDPQAGYPLTHLQALLQNVDFEIVGLVDSDVEICKKIQNRTGLSSDLFYGAVDEIKVDNVAVVVIATPAKERADLLKKIVRLKPQAIVFEKPLAFSSKEALKVQTICEEKNIKAIINFHRRYDPDHRRFFEQLPESVPERIVFHYGKGLWNYGSHGIDFIQNYFGAIYQAEGFAASDGFDPLVDGRLTLESGVIVDLISHAGSYDQFEFEFFYDDEKYNLWDGGVRKTRQVMHKNLHHHGYNHLGLEKEMMAPSKVYGLKSLYENMAKTCENPTYPLKGCDPAQAVAGIKIIETLIQTARERA